MLKILAYCSNILDEATSFNTRSNYMYVNNISGLNTGHTNKN
jgi:hypothetical protein